MDQHLKHQVKTLTSTIVDLTSRIKAMDGVVVRKGEDLHENQNLVLENRDLRVQLQEAHSKLAIFQQGEHNTHSSTMNAMPQWCQELNVDFMDKKRAEEFFLAKHHHTRDQAYKVRGDGVWHVGNRVRVVKEGSQFGKTAVVQIPNWDGRIMVKMDDVTMSEKKRVKSYMANEIQVITAKPRRQSLLSGQVGTVIDDTKLDEWGYDILALQNSLRSNNNDLQSLSALGIRLFERHEFSQTLGMQETRLATFFHKIQGKVFFGSCTYCKLSAHF